MNLQPISDFSPYCHTHIKGDQKGEAQTFLDLARVETIATKGTKPGMSLRNLYLLQELPGKNPIKDQHHALDQAVAEAYGLPDKSFFKKTNQSLSLRPRPRSGISLCPQPGGGRKKSPQRTGSGSGVTALYHRHELVCNGRLCEVGGVRILTNVGESIYD